MKKIIVAAIVGILCISPLCFGQDHFGGIEGKEAKDVAEFVKRMFRADIIKEIRERHPRASFRWTGRRIQLERALSTWLVCCEAKERRLERRTFYYWEVKITSINDDPDLIVKYNIPLQYL
jgi:hypothetical protein